MSELQTIHSVARDFEFFVAKKWKIASDTGGSGNTANIGSIHCIEDILAERGMFSQLGESWFDDYWMNYNKITMIDDSGKARRIRNLYDFVAYRQGNPALIVPKTRRNTTKLIGESE